MNNDQNNLNQVGTVPPNPAPVPPSPDVNAQGIAPANTIVAGPTPVPPVAPMPGEPVTPITPAPVAPVPSVTPTPVAPVSETPAAPAPINLQPEGVVVPPPVNTDTNAGVVEPLMSTSLNDVTSFQQPGPITDSSVPVAPMPPSSDANNQIGTIGGIPTPPPLPTEADAKPKKGGSKILIIILAVVLALGVGFGVYYFLVLAKDKNKSITPILDTLELGSTIDTSLVPLYVRLSGYTSADCSVTTTLNPSEFGTYEYTVTCGKNSVTSRVEVKDTKAPEVTLREVAVVPGTSVSPEDFVASSYDASEITYSFESEDDYSDMDEGSYDVNINVSDAYDNRQTYTGKLVIAENAPEHYTVCTSSAQNNNYQTGYVFGISSDGSIYNVVQSNVWTYNDANEYQTAVSSYRSTNSLDGISGNAVMDANAFTITIETDTTVDAIVTELALDDTPSTEDDLDELFEGTCAVRN